MSSPPRGVGTPIDLLAVHDSTCVFQYIRAYWHCPHNEQGFIRNGTVSVRPSVRLSVPAWAHSSKPAASGLLLWARQAVNIDLLLQQRRANAGSATLSAYVRS